MDELLTVCNLPKKEQFLWLVSRGYFWAGDLELAKKSYDEDRCDNLMAGLAFRLRDKAFANNVPQMWRAQLKVYCHLSKQKESKYMIRGLYDYYTSISWFCMYAQPIHWIIAALKAKEMSKE